MGMVRDRSSMLVFVESSEPDSNMTFPLLWLFHTIFCCSVIPLRCEQDGMKNDVYDSVKWDFSHVACLLRRFLVARHENNQAIETGYWQPQVSVQHHQTCFDFWMAGDLDRSHVFCRPCFCFTHFGHCWTTEYGRWVQAAIMYREIAWSVHSSFAELVCRYAIFS